MSQRRVWAVYLHERVIPGVAVLPSEAWARASKMKGLDTVRTFQYAGLPEAPLMEVLGEVRKAAGRGVQGPTKLIDAVNDLWLRLDISARGMRGLGDVPRRKSRSWSRCAARRSQGEDFEIKRSAAQRRLR